MRLRRRFRNFSAAWSSHGRHSLLAQDLDAADLRVLDVGRELDYQLSVVDGHALEALLPKLNPETTLFIICSKTFSTQETLMLRTQSPNDTGQEGGGAHEVRLSFL